MNYRLLALLNPAEVEVVIRLAEEAEVDEMWSYVGKKQELLWFNRNGHLDKGDRIIRGGVR